MWAAGFTEGGAPYGVTVSEFRQGNETTAPEAGWARAKAALREALKTRYGDLEEEDIGWVRFLAEGVSYRVFCAECHVDAADGDVEKNLVVRIPRPEALWELARLAPREVRVLEYLASLALPVRLPRLFAAVPTAQGLVLVQEMIKGLPLDLRAGRQSRVRPWEVVAEAASITHDVSAAPLRPYLRTHASCRDHAIAELRALAETELPEAKEAHAWALAHLPPDEPSRLLHGDLLGQNLLLGWEREALGIIDWEHAVLGDPAYDLAIVTRGSRRPFQIDRGLQRLLDAYNARAQAKISAQRVRLYELCLMARICEQEAREHGRESPALEHRRCAFRGLLERAQRA